MRIEIGDRIRLWGGYDAFPKWLEQREESYARITAFIPSGSTEPAAVAELEEPLTVEGYTGATVVLTLRWVEQTWEPEGVVHVELCDFEPETKPWEGRPQGRWVESHASYERVDPSR